MKPLEAVVLCAAVAAIVVGFALAWPPLGLISFGVALLAAWYFVIDDVGGDE